MLISDSKPHAVLLNVVMTVLDFTDADSTCECECFI